MGCARGVQEGEGRNSDTEPWQGRSRKGEDVTRFQGEGQGEEGDHHPVGGEDRRPGQRGLGRG